MNCTIITQTHKTMHCSFLKSPSHLLRQPFRQFRMFNVRSSTMYLVSIPANGTGLYLVRARKSFSISMLLSSRSLTIFSPLIIILYSLSLFLSLLILEEKICFYSDLEQTFGVLFMYSAIFVGGGGFCQQECLTNGSNVFL